MSALQTNIFLTIGPVLYAKSVVIGLLLKIYLKYLILTLSLLFQRSSRRLTKRREVHSVRSCAPDPGQGRDELHAAAQVHDCR